MWLKRFISNLVVLWGDALPVVIHCDSQATIAYTKDPTYHNKTNHIYIKYNFVRDMVAQKKVSIQCISTRACWQILLPNPFWETYLLATLSHWACINCKNYWLVPLIIYECSLCLICLLIRCPYFMYMFINNMLNAQVKCQVYIFK